MYARPDQGGHPGGPRPRHEVLDADWGATPVTRRLRQRAAAQLGSSGSGNHVAELGTLTPEAPALGLAVGAYVALLSHSGSPGTGAQVADHATRLAAAEHPEPPKVHKDIETVMAAQADPVEVVARIAPRIVKMAPAGERPED